MRIRHHKIKGICYCIEITEVHKGRCEEHNPKKIIKNES